MDLLVRVDREDHGIEIYQTQVNRCDARMNLGGVTYKFLYFAKGIETLDMRGASSKLDSSFVKQLNFCSTGDAAEVYDICTKGALFD